MNDDDFLKDILSSSSCSIEIDDSATILSFQDSIQVMIMKFGQDFMQNPFAKQIVVWNSRSFIREHVIEISSKYTGLLELCEEFYSNETIEGKPLDQNFYRDLFDFMQSFNLPPDNDHEVFGTSAV